MYVELTVHGSYLGVFKCDLVSFWHVEIHDPLPRRILLPPGISPPSLLQSGQFTILAKPLVAHLTLATGHKLA